MLAYSRGLASFRSSLIQHSKDHLTFDSSHPQSRCIVPLDFDSSLVLEHAKILASPHVMDEEFSVLCAVQPGRVIKLELELLLPVIGIEEEHMDTLDRGADIVGRRVRRVLRRDGNGSV